MWRFRRVNKCHITVTLSCKFCPNTNSVEKEVLLGVFDETELETAGVIELVPEVVTAKLTLGVVEGPFNGTNLGGTDAIELFVSCEQF